MSEMATLVADHLDIWTSAIERKSGAGRGGGKRINLHGIERLRALILNLAVRGKLVPQNAADEPATDLLPKMVAERQRRIKSGEIKNTKGPSKPISEPFDLPSGWMWIPLWQTGNIFTGNSINASVRSELEANENGRPFVATKDVGYGLDPIDYDNGLKVRLDDQRFNVARPNAVFICAEGGSAGRKIAISDREISFGNKLLANEPWLQINPRYLLYVYLSDFFFDCFSKEMTGIIGGISRAKFLALPFPLPPLAEQRRIAAKVDELMALCDALETQSASLLGEHQTLVQMLLALLVNSADATDLATNWARLETHFDTLFTTEASIDTLKQKILDCAVLGLLAPQDDRDETAVTLLARIQAERAKTGKGKHFIKIATETRGDRELPSGWVWTPLANLGLTMTGGTPRSAGEANFGGNIPFIGPGQISPCGRISRAEKFISEIGLKQSTEASPGDILMVCIGGSIGKSAIAQERIAYNQQINAIRPILIESRYVDIYLRCTRFQNEVLKGATGSATPIINRSKWEAIPIAVPPRAEQQRIVVKVDELMIMCDALNAGIIEAAQTQKDIADAIVERAAT